MISNEYNDDAFLYEAEHGQIEEPRRCMTCVAYKGCNDCEGYWDECMFDQYTDEEFHPDGPGTVVKWQGDNSCECHITLKAVLKLLKERNQSNEVPEWVIKKIKDRINAKIKEGKLYCSGINDSLQYQVMIRELEWVLTLRRDE